MRHETFINFDRQQWSKLADTTPLTLSPEELEQLKGINEAISLTEVRDIYLPLIRLLSLHIQAYQHKAQVLDQFLGNQKKTAPFIIGIAGSVAVGKSTTARLLHVLLDRLKELGEVSLVTTDGFLYSNAELEKRNLMQRKGFPQSYNTRALLQFIKAAKAGQPHLSIPIYSHFFYDHVPGQQQHIHQPDVLILEGLNVLQNRQDYPHHTDTAFVSDYVDFSIYVDANTDLLQQWYVERFQKLRASAFTQKTSYFHHYAKLNAQEAEQIALHIWQNINYVNLIENILPTREHANLILTKGAHHRGSCVCLKRT